MLTLASSDVTNQVGAIGVSFAGNFLQVALSDGREISLPMDKVDWLDWLDQATPEQKSKWSLEPNGFAIYWDDLDNGIEISHLLSMQALV